MDDFIAGFFIRGLLDVLIHLPRFWDKGITLPFFGLFRAEEVGEGFGGGGVYWEVAERIISVVAGF
jgi:hypothetical protein